MRPDLEPVGVSVAVRIAQRWGLAPVRAAMLVRRPDLFSVKVDLYGIGVGRFIVGKELSRPAEGLAATLSDPTLAVLDDRGGVHLVEVKAKFPGGGVAKEEMKHWRPGAVRVADRHGWGKNFSRVIEFTDSEGTLTMLTNLRSKGQRAALELFERETAGG